MWPERYPFLAAVFATMLGSALFVDCRCQEQASPEIVDAVHAAHAAETEPVGPSETSSLYHFGEAYGYMRPGDPPRFTFTRAVCVRYEHGPWAALGGAVPCFGFEDDLEHPED